MNEIRRDSRNENRAIAKVHVGVTRIHILSVCKYYKGYS